MNDDAKSHPSKRHLTLDNIGMLLRRVGEALEALHSIELIPWKDGTRNSYRHVMGPLPPHGIFYDRATRRPQISLVGVTNFLWRFFEPDTFRRIVGPKSGIYLLPEKKDVDSVDER